MKLLKKALVFLFVCGIFQSTVFALDGGFLIDNDTSFKTDKRQNYYLDQKDTATAWIKIPFGKNPENYFIAEGLYKFEYDQSMKQTYNYLDINLFKACFAFYFGDNALKFEAGRFFTSTLDPIVYSQNADGLRISFKNNILSFSAYGAYTGLLNSNVVKMIKTADSVYTDEKNVYSLSDKYLVTTETLAFENLFCNQNLALQFNGAFRLDASSNSKLYASLLMNGPIVGNLIYNVDATAAFTKYLNEETKVSVLARLILGYYFDIASVTANVVFASKDFTAVTSYAAMSSYLEPEYTGILKPGISVTFKPIENLLIRAGFDAAFDVARSYELKGIQYNIGVDYQILSDVYAGIKWNQYFDINNTDVNFGHISAKVKIAF